MQTPAQPLPAQQDPNMVPQPDPSAPYSEQLGTRVQAHQQTQAMQQAQAAEQQAAAFKEQERQVQAQQKQQKQLQQEAARAQSDQAKQRSQIFAPLMERPKQLVRKAEQVRKRVERGVEKVRELPLALLKASSENPALAGLREKYNLSDSASTADIQAAIKGRAAPTGSIYQTIDNVSRLSPLYWGAAALDNDSGRNLVNRGRDMLLNYGVTDRKPMGWDGSKGFWRNVSNNAVGAHQWAWRNTYQPVARGWDNMFNRALDGVDAHAAGDYAARDRMFGRAALAGGGALVDGATMAFLPGAGRVLRGAPAAVRSAAGGWGKTKKVLGVGATGLGGLGVPAYAAAASPVPEAHDSRSFEEKSKEADRILLEDSNRLKDQEVEAARAREQAWRDHTGAANERGYQAVPIWGGGSSGANPLYGNASAQVLNRLSHMLPPGMFGQQLDVPSGWASTAGSIASMLGLGPRLGIQQGYKPGSFAEQLFSKLINSTGYHY